MQRQRGVEDELTGWNEWQACCNPDRDHEVQVLAWFLEFSSRVLRHNIYLRSFLATNYIQGLIVINCMILVNNC